MTTEKIEKPPFYIHLSELPRTIFDLFGSYRFRHNYQPEIKGDGHEIVVLPGFLGSDFSTSSMRKFLKRIGYNAHPWDLGRNYGDTSKILPYIERKVNDLCEKSGKKVTLIGWSLGGIYARQVAKACPEKVRQVITLCSPFKIKDEPNYASGILEKVYKLKNIPPNPQELLDDMPKPAPVPTTAVYTKTDGIVPWQVCLEDEDQLHTNLEVDCGHIAVVFNKDALKIVAERLPLKQSDWTHKTDIGMQSSLASA